MANQRISPVWTVDRETLAAAVESSNTFKETLEKIGIEVLVGHYYKSLEKRCREEGIDFDSLRLRSQDTHRKRVSILTEAHRIPLDELLQADSPYERHIVKNAILKNKVIENKCGKCGLFGEWQGEPISLVLDHINGINNDHRIENLRFLCPNCHSQTKTFAGRNKKVASYAQPPEQHYCSCGKPISNNTKNGLCVECWRITQRKVERPDKETLTNLLAHNSYCAVARMYSVTDNAIRKWMKQS